MQRTAQRSRLQESDRSLIRHMSQASTFLIGSPAGSVIPSKRRALILDIRPTGGPLDTGIFTSGRNTIAGHGLTGDFGPTKAAGVAETGRPDGSRRAFAARSRLRHGVLVVRYLTSDCNPTPMPRQAEPIPAKQFCALPRQPPRCKLNITRFYSPVKRIIRRGPAPTGPPPKNLPLQPLAGPPPVWNETLISALRNDLSGE